ncbi:hypothetical protein L6452_01082 [Arctium lappa]|uniref:Uncharacterized protein n=1 Tax=Arctium lappa TaxID=4217 RepID=A0ACB9FFQ7_ARCLA|nr:hypothetical protein L6452_01082 [Arctium lappa]
MSVIVRDEDGKLLLLCKGADRLEKYVINQSLFLLIVIVVHSNVLFWVVFSVMFDRCAKNGRQFEEVTKEHVHDYADAGLRTLILGYRELAEDEYKKFNEKFTEAENSLSVDRDDLIDETIEDIKKDLILLGATVVEDNSKKGFGCSLLRQGMKHTIVTLGSPEIVAVEKSGEKNAIANVSKDSIKEHILAWKAQLNASSSDPYVYSAMVLDDKMKNTTDFSGFMDRTRFHFLQQQPLYLSASVTLSEIFRPGGDKLFETLREMDIARSRVRLNELIGPRTTLKTEDG